MFENKIPEWKNSGTEPSEELKNNGFQGGYKPPAGIFNWFWSLVSKCITEIQNILTGIKDDVERLDADGTAAIEALQEHMGDSENPHGVNVGQLGLDRVDNTPDSEKAVAFASEAGVGRKVEHDLTIRFKGGSTESTDMFTFNGSTSRSVNITPAKIGAAENDLSNVDDNVFAEKVKSTVATGTPVIEATSTDGEIYTATYDNITELYNGLEITIIPNMTSTKAAVQFNLNGFGAKNVRAKINGYNNGNSGTIAALAGWIGENVPLTIRYISKFDNWQTVDFSRSSATGLYGTIDIGQGGTGATTAAAALAALGGASTYIGQYKGAGTDVYGETVKNSITLPSRPKMVLIVSSTAWAVMTFPNENSSNGYYYAQLMKSYNDGTVEFYNNDTPKLSSTESSGIVVSWYSTVDAAHQLNSGIWYTYISIG